MPDSIKNGSDGTIAKVGSNLRLWTDAVTKTDADSAIEDGDAYNLNTGQISISATSAVMYIKNNESKNLFIEALAIGVGTGSFSDNVEIFIVRNPTTGTIIDDGTAIDMNINRSFETSNTLTADVYKGASAKTFTNGVDGLLIAQNGQGRVFASIGMSLAKGNTLGIRIQPNLSSGAVEVYAALICHLETET